jgi:hypothetical protein
VPELHELAQGELEVNVDLPKIQLYRCRSCGTERVCCPGRKTRCLVCLDERAGFEITRGKVRPAEELLLGQPIVSSASAEIITDQQYWH